MITHARRCAALTALCLAALTGTAAAAPVVHVEGGAVRGLASGSGDAFLGMPYAAAPTGELRWRPPRRPAGWHGVRDGTSFAASCPQVAENNPFLPPGPRSEDCLYLNVYTSSLARHGHRPVIVWIHGGGLTEDGARNYDGAKLARAGAVVVTINYRLGALGFLAHPALAGRPRGASGNYGLMDQIAALRWVRRNIAAFGGDPHEVTIAGQSAGGLSVLALTVSKRARGLFERAIVQSGAFALRQQPLAAAETTGEAVATSAGCPDQTAECLRHLPVDALVRSFGSGIPGVVDGRILTEPIGSALAAGRFGHVPILNGVNHDEELIFTLGLGLAVSGGSFVPVPVRPDTPEAYVADIAAVLGVSQTDAATVATQYPFGAYPSGDVAFETLVSDANFACPALQVDRWARTRTRVFAYEFDDAGAPERFGPLPPAATHSSELQYLFDQPNAPFPGTLTAGQQSLAASMRAAWAGFAGGDPATPALAWPPSGRGERVMSLLPPRPRLTTGFSDAHHCAFWAGRRP
jgi:para-nitrobenzyl esterase